MKKLNVLLILTLLCLVNCSNDDEKNSESNDVSGTIQLSGEDTATIGTTLTVGNINLDGLATTGTTKSVTLSDENTSIIGGEVESTNFSNAFIIVASEFTFEDNTSAQKVISMTIVSNSTEFRYGCLTPSNSSGFIDCGVGLKVDKEKKEVIFQDTTVENTETGAILTMNGTVTWN
ncbi:hypothetical protein CLV33_11178 [Jejuia pallidilutea]|jgi:hypothetical protein|uniref:Lipoprotein n=1 Tax=Jejuia pallidilutea TaxID=504487 RepID=A0A362X916_9FLAO|nr:hypothetical protein [Jejuia pallidilutea]PQV46027.1 hypothetical protein CLV33_11178 [Jejuia pallidilutea]